MDHCGDFACHDGLDLGLLTSSTTAMPSAHRPHHTEPAAAAPGCPGAHAERAPHRLDERS